MIITGSKMCVCLYSHPCASPIAPPTVPETTHGVTQHGSDVLGHAIKRAASARTYFTTYWRRISDTTRQQWTVKWKYLFSDILCSHHPRGRFTSVHAHIYTHKTIIICTTRELWLRNGMMPIQRGTHIEWMSAFFGLMFRSVATRNATRNTRKRDTIRDEVQRLPNWALFEQQRIIVKISNVLLFRWSRKSHRSVEICIESACINYGHHGIFIGFKLKRNISFR